jgi:hypothetical protein
MTSEDIGTELRRRKFRFVNEEELQQQIAAVLEGLGVSFKREFRFNATDRVDFWIPETGTAIEVKIKGGIAEVRRQLIRYSRHKEVKEVILASSRRQHAVNAEVNGSRIWSLNLWTL